MPTNPENFVDLKIVGVDKDQTNKPIPDMAMYDIYLTLSSVGNATWSDCFDEARRFPRHNKWRKAFCKGKYIVIQCPIEELEEHLEDLKKDVQTANDEYRKVLVRLVKEGDAQKAKEDVEKKKIDDALDNLNFD